MVADRATCPLPLSRAPGAGSWPEKLLKNFLKSASLLLIGIVIGAVLYAYAPEWVRTADSEPPVNFVAVTERLHTAGQPSIAQLQGLKASGYDLVVNLAPPQTFGSLTEESALVSQAGIRYLSIPVDWRNPTYDDFAFFSAVLKHSGAKRVLIHCQMNKRASLFTFLYRVVHEGVNPEQAYKSVAAVWVPEDQWAAFARDVLVRHNIDFKLPPAN